MEATTGNLDTPQAPGNVEEVANHVVVIATKYTTNYQSRASGIYNDDILINFQGNGTKSLHTSVNRSLQKLQTDYIDLVCFPNSPHAVVIILTLLASSMCTGGTSALPSPRLCSL